LHGRTQLGRVVGPRARVRERERERERERGGGRESGQLQLPEETPVFKRERRSRADNSDTRLRWGQEGGHVVREGFGEWCKI
jgi:hypothetical protein